MFRPPRASVLQVASAPIEKPPHARAFLSRIVGYASSTAGIREPFSSRWNPAVSFAASPAWNLALPVSES